tara:strand:+ start:3459 stop:4544 length:1086 start_codon:yes stop_codon:yes gene_type:complete
MKKSIFLNFAYGYGPFLRALDMAVEFNKKLVFEGHEPFRIISPLVYGDKQIQIAKETHPDVEIKFDINTGELLNKIFYKGANYSENLKYISENYFEIEEAFEKEVERLMVEENVVLEVSRNPRILSPIPLSYCSVMGLFSEFLKQSQSHGLLSGDYIDNCIKIAERIEDSQTKIFVSEPKSLGMNEFCVSAPFVGTAVEIEKSDIAPGIYFYKSGINEIKYQNIDFGKFKVYNSENDSVKIKFNKNILGVVARAGWGTISNSIILNKPLIIFPYSEGDDPEIFFNVETLKKLDIAAIYASDLSFGENMDVAISKIPNMIKFKENILSRYGTLDGSKYCAEVMYFDMLNVDRFLRFSDKEAL